MQLKIPQCPKHQKQPLFICSYQTCKQHRILCQLCKQKQTLHFSNHANYIYRVEKIREFDNAKRTQQLLDKGIADCESFVVEHRKFYTGQINAIRQDFLELRKQFMGIADQYEVVYVQGFQKQIQKFDQQLASIRKTLKQYTQQKSQQQSFFNLFFPSQPTQPQSLNESTLQALIKKNSKAFRVRAEIINMRSSLAVSKSGQAVYKGTEEGERKFRALQEELDYFVRVLYEKFRGILFGEGGSQELKGSIVSQTKSLAMSRVSMGNLIDLQRSQVSNTSQRTLQTVQLPSLDPVVNNVRQKLRPLQPKNKTNLTFQGPYLYSTGVYFGEMQGTKRTGWGQFVFQNGSIYEGDWLNDTICGYGRLIRNDCYYEGEVKNGRANGSGSYEDHYRHYSGEWRNDKRNGIGEEEFKNKTKKYTGAFVDDKYHGKGRLTTEQYVYQGKFKQGLFHGDGKIKYNNDQTFQGTFLDGQKQMGKHTYPDGSYYDGMFKDNVPNGTGEFYWSDGVKYSGQWRGGIQEGAGVQILQNGKEMKGIWRNGRWEKWI